MSRWLVLILVLAALAMGLSLAVWLNREAWLPEDVPVHWNARNEVDRTIPRDDAFWHVMIMPLVVAGVAVLAVVLPWLSPVRYKIEPFRPTWDYVMAVVAVLFFYINGVLLAAQMGYVSNLGRWLVGGMMIPFALLGNVLGKVKPNFWMGVRTPWTLASPVVWERTHRVAAWLFVGGSLLGLVVVAIGVGGEYNPLIAMIPFLVGAITPVFYSLVLYKRLEKQGRLGGENAGGTAPPGA
jgi:uncharacterized membrane protein